MWLLLAGTPHGMNVSVAWASAGAAGAVRGWGISGKPRKAKVPLMSACSVVAL